MAESLCEAVLSIFSSLSESILSKLDEYQSFEGLELLSNHIYKEF